MPAQSSVITAVKPSASESKSAACRQANTTIFLPSFKPANFCFNASLRPAMCASGISIPETISSMRRNGVDDGQAPTQIPQAAHKSSITDACCGWWRLSVRAIITTAPNGQSAAQRAQPLQWARSTCATRDSRRATLPRGRTHGSIANIAVSAAASTHTVGADSTSTSGCGNK